MSRALLEAEQARYRTLFEKAPVASRRDGSPGSSSTRPRVSGASAGCARSMPN